MPAATITNICGPAAQAAAVDATPCPGCGATYRLVTPIQATREHRVACPELYARRRDRHWYQTGRAVFCGAVKATGMRMTTDPARVSCPACRELMT